MPSRAPIGELFGAYCLLCLLAVWFHNPQQEMQVPLKAAKQFRVRQPAGPCVLFRTPEHVSPSRGVRYAIMMIILAHQDARGRSG